MGVMYEMSIFMVFQNRESGKGQVQKKGAYFYY